MKDEPQVMLLHKCKNTCTQCRGRHTILELMTCCLSVTALLLAQNGEQVSRHVLDSGNLTSGQLEQSLMHGLDILDVFQA